MNYKVAGLVVGALTALIAHESEAAFSGVTVNQAQSVNGRWVYSVYANFSVATDQIVKVKNWEVTSGTMLNCQHSDTALPLGSWNPNWSTLEESAVLSDSYVSITGLWNDHNTVINWTDGGPTIATGGGWGLPALGAGGVTVGSTLKVKIMQIAGTNLTPTAFHFSANLQVEWRGSTAGPTVTGDGTVTIPGPATILGGTILMFTGSRARRRRN